MKFSQAIIQNEIQSQDFLNWNSVRRFSNWNSAHKLFQMKFSQAIIQNKIQSENFLTEIQSDNFSLKFCT